MHFSAAGRRRDGGPKMCIRDREYGPALNDMNLWISKYVKLLTDNGIRISMTEKGDPYENAVAERVNGILKSEWIDEECFESFQAAKERIDQIAVSYTHLDVYKRQQFTLTRF